jgi:hypothetical protein
MKVKMFVNEGDIPKLEKEVNQWLGENNISALHINQSFTFDSSDNQHSALISVWYEEKLY